MRHIESLIVTAAVVSMLAATAAVARQPAHRHDAAKQAPAAATPSMPGPGLDAHMAQHMEMCRQMMGQDDSRAERARSAVVSRRSTGGRTVYDAG